MAFTKTSLQVNDLNDDVLSLAIENAHARRNEACVEISAEESGQVNGGAVSIVSLTPKCPIKPPIVVGIIIPPDYGSLSM